MIKCYSGCVPCCDFCIHCVHSWFEIYENGQRKWEASEPIACTIHMDEKHKRIAQSCGYCDDFHCFREPEQRRVLELFGDIPNINPVPVSEIIKAIEKVSEQKNDKEENQTKV